MTQVVDLETFITAANSDPDPDPDPNFPPESISIPIHDSIDYLDLSAAVYDRDDSTKESTNPKSQSHNPSNPTQTRSNSQRFSSQSSSTGTNLKANGPIIGLPNKIKHVTTCHVTRRNVKPNAPIFPKNKKKQHAAVEFEPSSPKVSCIGKVLSDRERRENCRRACRRRSGGSGCWAQISKLLFSCGNGKSLDVQKGEDIFTADVTKEEKPLRKRNIPSVGGGDDVAAMENIPGLGGMKRFSSGRRGESWGSDVELEGHVAVVDLSRRSSVEEERGAGGVHVI